MPTPGSKLTRRGFVTNSAAIVAGAAVATKLPPLASAAPAATDFTSAWENSLDRVWLGAEFWANPLQDWRVVNGRVECINGGADRNVHLMTRSLGDQAAPFDIRVQIGRLDGRPLAPAPGSVGLRIGIRAPLEDFRHQLIFGRGIDLGLAANGGLFIGSTADAKAGAPLPGNSAELRVTGVPSGANYEVTVALADAGGQVLASTSKTVPAAQCVGGVALVSNFGAGGALGGNAKGGGAGKAAKKGGAAAPAAAAGQFWFAKWRLSGGKVQAHAERIFGPLLFSQYTLSGGVMKMTAQLPPLGAADTSTVRLELKSGASWCRAGQAPIHQEARLAAFRIEKWDASKDVEYRLVYALKARDGSTRDHYWGGTVRRDPVDQPVISIADVSCNIQTAFPNAPYVASTAKLNPDLLAFTGDQFYESSGGYGVIRTPTDLAMIDYLRKWYLHGWTWRELTRDRPSVSIPDDHDVYQGNIWGEGGRGRVTTQEAGGYDMPVDWVNVVYRTQTAHHPDAYDASPAERGTLQYYGPMTYGRISFAILADRQYKSGPEGKVPPTGGPRGDHVTDPNFDPKTADIPGLVLLGAKQEEFLRKWVRDWRGAEMKAVISQTIFTSFPTTHGGDRMILRADYDTNGWPQTPRNRAVREIRKAFAFHLAGDQHIPGVVHYGVDEHRDGGVAFAGPAANAGYPRWFEPERAPWTKPRQQGVTGDFTDSFGNPITVLAVKNGAVAPRGGDLLQNLEEKASGIGVVRFDKRRRKIGIDCWPMLADVTKASTQMPGWPLEIDLLENYGRKVVGHLPPLTIAGVQQPLIEVTDQGTGELVYVLRPAQPSFRPHVFAAGKYTVKVSDPESGKSKELRDLQPATGTVPAIKVSV